MNTPPISPSVSSSSHTSESSSDGLHWQPGNQAPALQLPAGLHAPLQGQANAMLNISAAYQANIPLPASGQGWMLPHIPQFLVGEASSSSPPSMLDVHLRQWVGMAGDPEIAKHRGIAEQQILNVLKGNSGLLVLENLKLGELPDVFGHPDLSAKLNTVDISMCALDRLPASLLRLPNLQHLSVIGCPIGELPEFGEMPCLQTLHLSENSLTRLPDSIGTLTNLERLTVDSNNLEALPDSLVQLSKLQEMDVSFNQITRLPDGMTGMSSLQSLDVSANLLQTLPDDLASLPLIKLQANQSGFAEIPPVIFSMEVLEELKLNLNQMTMLPPEIAQLQNLTELDVSFCRLSSLPEEIAQLPHDCEVEVGGNPLSEAIRGNFARIYEEGGPQIQFTVDEGDPVARASQPLEANVTKWMKDLSPEQLHKWQQLGTESRADHFNTWLEFMDQTADFKNEQTRPHLEQRMRHLLSDMTHMLETRGDTQLAVYLGIAEEATSSCRDRIAVGLNNMELQQVNFRAGKGELSSSQLMTLGREMFIREQIGQIAAEKVKRLRMVDEVEVHLAFQVGLQKSLGLTLGNQDMLYRTCSQVRDKDLRLAGQQIQASLNTPALLRDFLADWAPLREFVKQRHADDWQTIEHSFQQREDRAYGQDGDTDWRALEGLGTEREQAFHALCAQKVEELLTTDLPSSSRPPEEPSASKRPRLE